MAPGVFLIGEKVSDNAFIGDCADEEEEENKFFLLGLESNLIVFIILPSTLGLLENF